MAPGRRVATIASVALGLFGVCAPAAGAADFVRAPGGSFLTDSHGRRLLLHGANLVPKCGSDTHGSKAPGTPCLPGGGSSSQPGYLVTPDAADPGRRFTAADAATLARLGFRVVRLGIVWSGLEPGPKGAHPDDPAYCTQHAAGTPFPALGAADPYRQADVDAYLRKLDVTVGLLARRHIRVLIDMHQDGWGRPFANPDSAAPWMSEGAPAWATCTTGAPFGKPATWQSTYTDPAVNSALGHFWANDVSADLQGQFARVWKAVAKHYAGNDHVLGYDLFNEPSGPTLLSPPVFDRQLACAYSGSAAAPAACAAGNSQAPNSGLVPTVRSVDPDHVVFFEASVLTDFGAPTTLGAPGDLPFGGLGLSFHVYGGAPGSSTFQCDQPECGPQEQRSFDTFDSERAAMQTSQPGGPAWLLSEFGAEDYVPDVARVADAADRHLASWTYWSTLQLHDPTGGPTEGLLDEHTRRPDSKRASVLARTYALATAGTPTSQSFDPATEAYDLTYAPDPSVHAPTEIVVPVAYHYAHGYDVQVTGGRATSAPDVSLLTVASDAGAKQVIVRVRRRTAPRAGHRCTHKRRLRIVVHARRGERLLRVTVYRGHKPLRRVRHPGRRRAVVRVRVGPRPRIKLRVVVSVRRRGHVQRRVLRHSYRGCV